MLENLIVRDELEDDLEFLDFDKYDAYLEAMAEKEDEMWEDYE